MKRRLRWTRVLSVGLVLAAVGVWPVAARSAKPAPEPAPKRIQVQYGDSLWTLARRYGDPRQDVRRIVARLMRDNRVDAGALQPGQVLLLSHDCLPESPE